MFLAMILIFSIAAVHVGCWGICYWNLLLDRVIIGSGSILSLSLFMISAMNKLNLGFLVEYDVISLSYPTLNIVSV